jgi:hypothetical protein
MRQAQDINGPRFGSGIADQITIELHQPGNYSNIVYTASNVNLFTNGNVSLQLPFNLNASYYITIKHRNSIRTTTFGPVSFSSSTINYSFSTSANQAYGSNQKSMFGSFVIYGGDLTQDGITDGSDMAAVENASTALLLGYFPEDLNGDGVVDGSDMSLLDNNSTNLIHAVTP